MFPNLRIFFLTVGEDVSFESLDAIKKHTHQPYKLTIWYDACGRGVNQEFYKRLFDYTDDVILLSQNHGPTMAFANAILYLDGDYVLMVLADTVVQEGYLDKFSFCFGQMHKLACAGSFRVKDPVFDFVLNSMELMPDGVQMFSREAINEVGGVASRFRGMGMENREWHERAVRSGWNVVTCKGIMKEIGTTHDGRSLNQNLDSEISESTKTFLKVLDSNWKDFKWWEKERITKREEIPT